jgi:hypothetical protein
MRFETAFNRKAIHANQKFVESPEEWHPDLFEATQPKARYQTIIVYSTTTHPSSCSRFNPKARAYPLSEFPLHDSLKAEASSRAMPAIRVMFHSLQKTKSLSPKKQKNETTNRNSYSYHIRYHV